MSESFNINDLKNNNIFVIRKLYSDLYPAIQRFLMSKGCKEQDCEDIIQDTFVDGLANIQSGKFKESSKIGTYFNSIAKFKFYNLTKRNKHTLDISNIPSGMKQEQEIEIDETDLAAVTKALAQISGSCKKILEGFYYYEKNLKELALELEITYDFIRIKKRRCMNTVKEIILKNMDNG